MKIEIVDRDDGPRVAIHFGPDDEAARELFEEGPTLEPLIESRDGDDKTLLALFYEPVTNEAGPSSLDVEKAKEQLAHLRMLRAEDITIVRAAMAWMRVVVRSGRLVSTDAARTLTVLFKACTTVAWARVERALGEADAITIPESEGDEDDEHGGLPRRTEEG